MTLWLGIGLIWIGMTTWLFRQGRRAKTSVHGADVMAGGLLWGLVVGFFWRTLSGDVYQPADGGDLVSFLFPTYRFAATQIQQGTLPLWNPTLYAGAPFIGDIQAGFLYVPNLILFYLRPDFDYSLMQWLAIGHLYWAGLGMYVFLRTWRQSDETLLARPAAFFGAVAFAFCDPLLAHIGNLNLIAVLSWLPWILAAYQQALYWRSLRWAAIAGFLFAFANFAGHAQSTYYIGLVLLLYTLGHWAYKLGEWQTAMLARRITLPKVIAVIQYPLITATLTVLLTAPILLPAMELARLTERHEFTYQDTVAYSLAPTQAIGVITPGFFGRGPALHWSLWSRIETPYVGVVTLILAAAALLLTTPSQRKRLWVWVGIAVAGFSIALGLYAIVHGWLTFVLPLFDQFRAPARALILWSFGVTVLAAVGMDVLLQTKASGGNGAEVTGWEVLSKLLQWGGLILLGIVLPLGYFALLLTQENEIAFLRASIAALALTLATVFWVSSWLLLAMYRARWFSSLPMALLLSALLFFDLAATGAYTDISSQDPTVGYDNPAIIEFLRNEPELGRIDTLTDIDEYWQPDSAALYALEDVGGIANPLMLEQWHQLWEGLGGRQSKLYDMLHVTHVIVHDDVPLPPEKFVPAFDAPGELTVYQNSMVLPRAWFVHDVSTVETVEDALTIMQMAEFDPRHRAVVHGQESSVQSIGVGIADQISASTVQLTHRDTNALSIAVQTDIPGLLVLSELWYPGWRATVNGEATTIVRTNMALRGVPIPAGDHVVEVWFAPDSWRAGLLSAIARLAAAYHCLCL